MSTTPTQPPPTQAYERPHYGGGPGMPPVPFPSGELVVFLLVWAVIGIITVATDGRPTADQFVTLSVYLAIGYMLARGIAKAGRVFENR